MNTGALRTRLGRPGRRGTTAVEVAVVAVVLIFLLLGLLAAIHGTACYQRVAFLAREASRWASVRGTDCAQETGQAAATPDTVYSQVIAPNAAGLDLSKLTYSVTWNPDNHTYHTATVNGTNVKIANVVTVTVTYQWVPAILGGSTFSSTSASAMCY